MSFGVREGYIALRGIQLSQSGASIRVKIEENALKRYQVSNKNKQQEPKCNNSIKRLSSSSTIEWHLQPFRRFVPVLSPITGDHS